MIWLQSKLNLFTSAQRIDIISHLTPSVFNSLDEEEQSAIKYLFTWIGSETSKRSIALVYDCLMTAVLYKEPIRVFRVHQGENFTLVIEPEQGDNYTGYTLVGREHITNKLLASKAGTAGTNQHLDFVDLDLEKKEFYKVRIQLEESSTPGDGVSLLGSVYFVVVLNIDDEE